MAEAGVGFSDLDAVAVTQGPGLVGSLLVGVQAAKAIALVHGKPLVPVHHVAGHIEAAFLAHGEIPLPALALVVVRRAHQPLRGAGARASIASSAARATTRPARPSTRSRSSWASATPAGPSSTASPRAPTTGRSSSRSRGSRTGGADFSFSGIKTAVLLHVKREGIAPVADPASVPRRGARPRRLLPARGGRPRSCAGSSARREEHRPAEPDRDRRGRRQLAPAARGRAGRAARWACRSSSRRSPSPPTTPP